MICLTGDTHRDFTRVELFCARLGTSRDDVLVVLGDAGINYFGEPSDGVLKAKLSELPITLLCVHGNHEQRPESIGFYQESERFGGTVYWEPTYPNLLFAKDGEIYELDGKRCITLGGAYSVDKFYRLVRRMGWWEDEQPSDEIKARVEASLEKADWSVDCVFSHTCPFKYIPQETFLPSIDQSSVDNGTEKWLGDIEGRLSYSRWYCGHYHTNKDIDKMRFLFEGFLELGQ